MKIEYRPIGLIHTPFKERHGMPIQPSRGRGVHGTVEVFPEYGEGLADLDGFSHIVLIYHFHRSEGFDIRVTPFLDTEKRGLFATRAPRRPNAVGLSVVRLVRIEGNRVEVQDLDAVGDEGRLVRAGVRPQVRQRVTGVRDEPEHEHRGNQQDEQGHDEAADHEHGHGAHLQVDTSRTGRGTGPGSLPAPCRHSFPGRSPEADPTFGSTCRRSRSDQPGWR